METLNIHDKESIEVVNTCDVGQLKQLIARWWYKNKDKHIAEEKNPLIIWLLYKLCDNYTQHVLLNGEPS